jgi:DNA recombination protein RmuC
MKESNVNSAKDKASLEQIIKLMMSKTEALGEEAEKLARALTTNGKTQGDFGEMVLENILEHSGLEENISYFKQKSYDIGQNKRFRPDVVVKFPENRSIIIDSKTSLTAYNNYINATNDIERKEALKAHMESVKKHIDELSEKDYTQLEDNIIGYVLMFMPNEGAYILAVNEKLKEGNQLINAAQYAYNKRVLLINPTNLMMALQLAKNLWISADQKKNIQEIVRQGTAMYEKFTGFLDDFDKIGKQISSVQMVWDAASKKLSEGKGNLVGRAEKMRLLGLDTKKQIATERVEKALEE